MIPKNFSLMYIGEQSNQTVLRMLLQNLRDDCYLYVCNELEQALATYIYDVPHLIVVEGNSNLVKEVFFHISSVTKPPPRIIDAVLMVADEPIKPAPPATIVRQYPPQITEADLFNAIVCLLQARDDEVFALLHSVRKA